MNIIYLLFDGILYENGNSCFEDAPYFADIEEAKRWLEENDYPYFKVDEEEES